MAKRGPKTDAGRRAVRFNAIKHGLTASSPVIAGFESEEAWQDHLERLLHDYAPETYMEECLIRQIADLLWRLERIPRVEKATIGSNQQWIIYNYYAKRRSYGISNPDPQARSRELMEASKVPSLLVDLLDLPAKATVARADACLMLRALREVAPGLADNVALPDESPLRVESLRSLLEQCASRQSMTLRSLVTDVFTKLMDKSALLFCENSDFLKYASSAAVQGLIPDEGTLNKLMRYESHLHRQLVQTMHVLEDIQNKRQAKVSIPARLEIVGVPEGTRDRVRKLSSVD